MSVYLSIYIPIYLSTYLFLGDLQLPAAVPPHPRERPRHRGAVQQPRLSAPVQGTVQFSSVQYSSVQ